MSATCSDHADWRSSLYDLANHRVGLADGRWRCLAALAVVAISSQDSRLGRLRRLATTHWTEPGWIGRMLDFLLNPPPWTALPIIIVGLGLIYWDNVRRRHNGMPHQRSVSSSTAPVVKQSPPKAIPPVAMPPHLPANNPAPISGDPDDLGRLFTEELGSLRLRFLPDTHEPFGDTFLLLLFGYWRLRGRAEVSKRTMRASLVASNAFRMPRQDEPVSKIKDIINDLNPDEIARQVIFEGLVVKNRLSEGGFYHLTDKGAVFAQSLAADLIERA